MTAENYKGSAECVLSPSEKNAFDNSVQRIKATMKSYGISQQAIDDFQFTLKAYTLQIDPAESANGAFHVYADGNPFYEMRMSTPGSIMELSPNASSLPMTVLNDKDQGLSLFFELAVNLVGKVGQVLAAQGVDPKNVHGGGSMPFHKAEYDTTFRCAPAQFVDGLNALLDYRLGMLLPKQVVSAQPAPKASKPPRP